MVAAVLIGDAGGSAVGILRCVGKDGVVGEHASSPSLVGCDACSLRAGEIEEHDGAGDPALHDHRPRAGAVGLRAVDEDFGTADTEVGGAVTGVNDGVVDDDLIHRQFLDGVGDGDGVLCVLPYDIFQPGVDDCAHLYAEEQRVADVDVDGRGDHAEVFDAHLRDAARIGVADDGAGEVLGVRRSR